MYDDGTLRYHQTTTATTSDVIVETCNDMSFSGQCVFYPVAVTLKQGIKF